MELTTKKECPKCGGKAIHRMGAGRRVGNWWYEPYKCGKCHDEFEVGEEIKARGN